MSEAPHFRFNPNAYENSCLEESDDACGVCGRACGWRYVGNIYMVGDPPIVCARCIAEGGLGRKYSCGFHDMEFSEEPDAALVEEIEVRTPGFATYNPFTWPVRDGMPMAFVGYGDDRDLLKAPGVLDAVEGVTGFRGASSNTLIFREVDGDGIEAVLDLD